MSSSSTTSRTSPPTSQRSRRTKYARPSPKKGSRHNCAGAATWQTAPSQNEHHRKEMAAYGERKTSQSWEPRTSRKNQSWQRDQRAIAARSPRCWAQGRESGVGVTGTMAARIFMGDLLPGLIVLAFSGSIAPPLLLLTILFLGSRRPLLNAAALALGYFTTCAVIGISGLVLFGGAQSIVSTVGRVISATIGALLIVLGLRSLLASPDPDVSQPRWMQSINAMSPPRAFGFGTALFPLQVNNLAIFVATLNLIIASSLSPRGSIVALMLVLVVFAIPVLVLIGLYAAFPHRASTMLGSLQTWMRNNNRSITVVLCFVFGAFFLVRGLSGA